MSQAAQKRLRASDTNHLAVLPAVLVASICDFVDVAALARPACRWLHRVVEQRIRRPGQQRFALYQQLPGFVPRSADIDEWFAADEPEDPTKFHFLLNTRRNDYKLLFQAGWCQESQIDPHGLVPLTRLRSYDATQVAPEDVQLMLRSHRPTSFALVWRSGKAIKKATNVCDQLRDNGLPGGHYSLLEVITATRRTLVVVWDGTFYSDNQYHVSPRCYQVFPPGDMTDAPSQPIVWQVSTTCSVELRCQCWHCNPHATYPECLCKDACDQDFALCDLETLLFKTWQKYPGPPLFAD